MNMSNTRDINYKATLVLNTRELIPRGTKLHLYAEIHFDIEPYSESYINNFVYGIIQGGKGTNYKTFIGEVYPKKSGRVVYDYVVDYTFVNDTAMNPSDYTLTALTVGFGYKKGTVSISNAYLVKE